MSALFLQCSGMRANQSTLVVYIASSLFWWGFFRGEARGFAGILSGFDVFMCVQGREG